ncbi:sensor histidine kinase [Nonomuraea jiangxiensis]|uniref:sensor histidine kinase n=1 Tax=Nonomuraea jiangxiensis TaxID=633440 RepID=UPI000ABAB2FC|nr:histidine kinase [Nonomuraea jiangxiensis]
MTLTSADEVRIGRLRSRRGWVVGLAGFVPALAGAVAVVLGDLAGGPGWHLVADLVGGALACAGVLLCRRWPVSAGLAVIALSVPAASASVAAGIAALMAALYRRPRVAIAVGAAGVGATLVRFALRPPGLAPYAVWALVGVLFGVAVTAWGLLARTRRELLLSLAERARRAEAEQRLRAEEARRAERLGIAREMHDVLAHRLSLLAVHAGALEFNADATPGEVAEAAGVIRSSARLALEELRSVISVLRDQEPPPSPGTGSPPGGGVDLGALVEESRQAGMRVEVRDHGVRLSEVPDGVGRAAYRIVQEGLTNARKHAPGQPVTVLVSGTRGAELVVEVRNPLHSGPAPATTGAGAGLAGLAERASLAGGRLECGETADGGFRLVARLPWPRCGPG